MSEIKASDPESSGPAKIVGPVLGFELKKSPARRKNPHKFSEHVVIFFNLRHVTRELWDRGQVEIQVQGLGQRAHRPITSVLSLRDYPFDEVLVLTHSFPAQEFSPDVYEVRLSLMNGRRNTINQEAARFIISPRGIIPHPGTQGKSTPPEQT